MSGVRNCRDCGRGPLIPAHLWRAGQRDGVQYRGRGLCHADYAKRQRAGTLDEVPRRNRPAHGRASVIRQYMALRDQHLTMTAIADRIGIERTALYGALRRDGHAPKRLDETELARLRRMVGVA